MRVKIVKCNDDKCTVRYLGEVGEVGELRKLRSETDGAAYVIFNDGFGFYFAEEHLEVFND